MGGSNGKRATGVKQLSLSVCPWTSWLDLECRVEADTATRTLQTSQRITGVSLVLGA